ncbi:MAG: hypothetical protein AB7S26_42340 [Sandaracinaceae bacterium]
MRNVAPVLSAACLFFVAPAWAQEQAGTGPTARDTEDARQHFEVASRYYERGEFELALHSFEAAYALDARPELLYNIGLAHRELGHLREAVDAWHRYLADMEEPPFEERVRARLRAMEAELARREASDSTSDDVPPPDDSSGGGSGDASLAGWIVMSVGLAAVLSGAITGGLALDAEARLDALCDDMFRCTGDWMAQAETGGALVTATNVLLITGASVAATGLVVALVLMMQGGSDDSARAGLACTPEGCAASLTGSF